MVLRKVVIVPTKRPRFLFSIGKPVSRSPRLRNCQPQTDIPEEFTAPTQPFSVGMPRFDHERLREADMWGIAFDHASCRIQFKRMRYGDP